MTYTTNKHKNFKKITELNVGDLVLSYNIFTGEYEYKPVTTIFDNGIKEVIQIKTENERELVCTPNHAVLTKQGFRYAGEANDLFTDDGESEIVSKEDLGCENVYDIEVKDNHTFCVKSKNGFVNVKNCGAQTPFSSINYGTCTSPEGRMVTKQVMLATMAGLGHGETPIFPVQIFKVLEGVNFNKEDPNYDLFKLSIKCSAKRLFPNYTFIDSWYNKQYYQPGKPETEVSVMGKYKNYTY